MMQINNHWQLPDGVEELLPPQAQIVESLRRSILDQFESCGYELVTPPMIEYLESLLSGTGNDLHIQTFKVTDQLTGRMMGIRADITPQVARIDAHVLKSEGVKRLCYTGTVLHTTPAHMLTNRCPTQIGCELFGSNSLSADLEILDTMLRMLQGVSVQPLYLDLSHVDLVEGIVEQGLFSDAEVDEILSAFGRKSIPDLAELIEKHESSNPGGVNVIACLKALATLGGKQALSNIRPILDDQFDLLNDRVSASLKSLDWIVAQLAQSHADIEIGFDFCELRGYRYHTGLVFAVYTADHRYAVAQGGRYDAIGAQFGHPRSAVGFSADLKVLAQLTGFRLSPKKRILAPAILDPKLDEIISAQRHEAVVVRCLDKETAQELNCSAELVKENGVWQVRDL